MSYPMPMNMIQQMLMGVPRTPSEPSSNEDSFQFDQPRYDPSVKFPSGQVITPRGGFNPFRGGYQRPSFGRPPMMGGFGGFGGYGSPFGGLGMFGMSPYGGMPNYGMFGGMMSPYMGGMGGMFGGGGMNRPPAQPVPRAGSTPPQQSTYYQGSAFTPNFQLPSQPPQQSTQGGNYMGPNMNNSFMQMQNPFMSGLGSMMGSMFGGGYGSNVSNTQANVAQ